MPARTKPATSGHSSSSIISPSICLHSFREPLHVFLEQGHVVRSGGKQRYRPCSALLRNLPHQSRIRVRISNKDAYAGFPHAREEGRELGGPRRNARRGLRRGERLQSERVAEVGVAVVPDDGSGAAV